MNDSTKKVTPAYTTYKSFVNLINDLRENGIQPHITRSVVKGSNSGKAMMTASLKALGLIDEDTVPTEKLSLLVNSTEDYSTALNLVLQEAYPFLFDGSVDLSNTTTEKVAEKFKEAGATGSTITKSMHFFLSAAKEAEVEVHSRVKAPAIDRSKQTRRKSKLGEPKDESEAGQGGGENESEIPEGMERITVPLRNMEDGVIYFPAELEQEEAKKAVKMAVFILNNFYGIDS
ncbi:Uncharacterised protein [Halioglobus japonicus]|nr:Uncharacterised protein [Halioglobus japonicus]